MGQFLGWASYDIKRWCPHCEEEYDHDPEYADEHRHCKEKEEEDE